MDLQKLVGGPLKVERVIANRPRLGPIGSYVTTPSSARMMELLGVGATSKAVALSKSELEAIRRMYSEAIQALYDLQTIRQTIGHLGPMLKRTKPGSKRHQDYYDRLTRLENDASELSSKVAMFLKLVPLG